MLKFFKNPFAIIGTRAAIPAADPGTGEVNYPTGFPAPYQLPKTDPLSRNIPRDQTNQLYFDITSALQELQGHGVPDFITTALNEGVPYSYSIGDRVRYDDGTATRVYESLTNANTALPTVAASWRLVRTGTPISVAGGTGNALTAAFVPTLYSLRNGDVFILEHTAANTGAATLAIDGGAALAVVKGADLPLIAGDIPGANSWGLYVYDASLTKFVLVNPANGVNAGAKQIQTITGPVAANAMTVGLAATTLDFRANTANSGVVTTIGTGALSLVVPSGATLGLIANQAARLAVLALNNAGTAELAIVNLAGGLNLDETGIISTTALSAAADSASVIYSTTARTSVPYRVVGFLDVVLAVPGTWDADPFTIQGTGGNAFTSLQSLGYRLPVNQSGSRSAGVTYYNTSGRPRYINITSVAGAAMDYTLLLNGAAACRAAYNGTSGIVNVSGIVQPGGGYSLTLSGTAISTWMETD